MQIRIIEKSDTRYHEQIKYMLTDAFPHSYKDCADEEILNLLDYERILLGAFENDLLIGIIGAIPQYGITGWELHPIIVRKEFRFNKIGTKLLKYLENEVVNRGGITIYLGTDDEFNKTSLSNTDLFDNTYEKIKEIKNIRNHPYEFYMKNGYTIVGVIPDANGKGKPDIIMAKRISNQ